MSIHRSVRGAVALVCLLAVPGAFAQLSDPRVSAFGGASLLGGDKTFAIGTDLFRTRHTNGAKFGARVTANLLPWYWGLEGTYSFSTNDLVVTEITPQLERRYDVSVHQFMGNALYFLTPRSNTMRPFLTFGAGISRFNMSEDSKNLAAQRFLNQSALLRGENKFTVNFGAGIEARPWERYGFRLDFRDYMSGVPRFGLSEQPPNAGASYYPAGGVVHRIELSGSIVLFFGDAVI